MSNTPTLLGIVVALILLFTWNDLTRKVNASNDDGVRKLKTDLGVPVIKILMCHSWGYQKAFEQYAAVIKQHFSEVKVEGANYPPPSINSAIASVISITKFVVILCLVSGVDPFNMIGQPTPNAFLWAKENKMYACFMLFFLGNAIENQLTSTGAFEIMLNDNKIWSKLQSGRVPRVEELLQILESNINYGKFSGTNNL